MWHRNAKLTYLSRIDLVRQVEAGWSQSEVARQFRVSRPTVSEYVRRYAEEGISGLLDRSSRPLTSPRLTPPWLVRAICKLRRKRGWGPDQISWRLKIPRSTIYAVLRRAGISRLAWLHRTTRKVVRYEHPNPGDMLHLDVKKLGRVPVGAASALRRGLLRLAQDHTPSGPKVSTTCTWPSTTTPGLCTWKRLMMKREPRPRSSSSGRSPFSQRRA